MKRFNRQGPWRSNKQSLGKASNSARSRKRPLWLDVTLQKSRNIRRLRPRLLPVGKRFETVVDAKRIDEANIALLMPSRPDLAAEIERYELDGAAGTSPASYRAARRFRIYDIAERLRIADMFQGPHEIATIYLRAFPAGQLHAADLKRAHGALRKILKRAGFTGFILIGGTEFAWLARHGLWIFHCHLLAIDVGKADWDRLRDALPNAGPAAALKVQVLKNWPKQLSYCQKFNSSHKPGKRGPNGNAPYRPLPTAQLIEWVEWMSKQRFEDFGFLFGARRRGGRIVVEV